MTDFPLKLEGFRGFMPCEEPRTWAEVKEMLDVALLDMAHAGQSIVAIESITFGQHYIGGWPASGYLISALGVPA
jgi:hypothetical protein